MICRIPLWQGADIVCKEPLDIPGLEPISVGTKGYIHSFVDRKVNICLSRGLCSVNGRPSSIKISEYLNQLRIDFIYYWNIVEGCKPPEETFHKVRPMIIHSQPDMFTSNIELISHIPSGKGKNIPKKYIGYWSTSKNYNCCYYDHMEKFLPWPGDYIDTTWDKEERDIVIKYLKSHPAVNYWKGYSWCRLDDKVLGAADISDGTYVWPEGFDYYLEVHGVKPPDEFIQHVLRNAK